MSLVIAMVIGGIFGVSFGWCWGYHTRPTPRRIWSCARCDEEAIARYFDQPDDPRSNAA